MPLYIIENEKGEQREMVCSVERRNCVPKGWKRVFVPTRGYLKGAIEEGSPEGCAPKAYRQIEEQGTNWREIERQVGLPCSEIRKIWDF